MSSFDIEDYLEKKATLRAQYRRRETILIPVTFILSGFLWYVLLLLLAPSPHKPHYFGLLNREVAGLLIVLPSLLGSYRIASLITNKLYDKITFLLGVETAQTDDLSLEDIACFEDSLEGGATTMSPEGMMLIITILEYKYFSYTMLAIALISFVLS